MSSTGYDILSYTLSCVLHRAKDLSKMVHCFMRVMTREGSEVEEEAMWTSLTEAPSDDTRREVTKYIRDCQER